MRILHTADWHLGRSFGALSLASDQAAFVDWFVDCARSEAVDLVVVAGDLYDRAIAPVDAIDLFGSAVRRLRSAGVLVAAITGNHDAPDRVVPYGNMLDDTGFILRGGYDAVGEVVRLDVADGPIDLVLLPFLDPQAAPDDFGADDGTTTTDDDRLERRRARTHAGVLRHAAGRARSLLGPRSVAVAHAFVSGGATSDSERLLTVGGGGDVPVDVFDGFTYTALGHLHRPQDVGTPQVRYSGSPLAYSFSEEHPKSVTLLEMGAEGTTRVQEIPVPVGRPVRTLTGTIDELLDPARHPDAHGAFVRAVLTDRETVIDAKVRLQAVYPHVAEIEHRRPVPDTGSAESSGLLRRRVAVIDAARAFWEAAEGTPPDAEIDAILVEEAAAVETR